MSNCIKIYTTTVIPYDQFRNLRGLLSKVLTGKQAYDQGHHFGEESIPYWFLTPSNVRKTDDGLEIEFGEGRSMHTWRDFYATLIYISKYLKSDQTYMDVEMSDESDGFEAVYPAKFNFANPREEC